MATRARSIHADRLDEQRRLTRALVEWDANARAVMIVMQGDPGFPDLVLARTGRVIFAELKAEAGKTTPAQEEWIAELGGRTATMRTLPASHEVYEWRPSDLDAIAEVLR